MTLTAKMQSDAVQMLKAGWPVEAVVKHLVGIGAAPEEATAYLDELARLKREAEDAGVAAPQARGLVACASCGKRVATQDTSMTGDGPMCSACYQLRKAREDHERSLVEAGVSRGSLQAAASLGARWCPVCKAYTMSVNQVTHHVSKSRIGLSTFASSDGRTEKYACGSCSHTVELDSMWRFLETTAGALVIGVGCLVWGVGQSLADLRIWSVVSAVVGVLAIVFGALQIVERVRHPAR